MATTRTPFASVAIAMSGSVAAERSKREAKGIGNRVCVGRSSADAVVPSGPATKPLDSDPMLGRSRPVTFDPYARRRGRRLPRWLVLLVSGIAIGAAAIVVAQQRWLPPRLSAEASAKLESSYQHADAERARLAGELEATAKRLE